MCSLSSEATLRTEAVDPTGTSHRGLPRLVGGYGTVRRGNRVSVRAGRRVVEELLECGDARAARSACSSRHASSWATSQSETERVDEERLGDPVPPHDVDARARGRSSVSTTLGALALDEALRLETTQRRRHRGTGDPDRLGDLGRPDRRPLLGQPVDGLEVLFERRGGHVMRPSWRARNRSSYRLILGVND